MVKEFKLPDIGEGIHEGEVVRWLVAEGDTVTEDQPIAEVMTDKATVEITTPFAGTVAKLGSQEGETILVGATLIEIDEEGGAAEAAEPSKKKAEKTEKTEEAEEAEEAGKADKTDKTDKAEKAEKPEKAEKASAKKPEPVEESQRREPAQAKGQDGGPVLATPSTRRLARELGVELAEVSGSGPKGRITRDDVERAASGAESAPRVEPPPEGPAKPAAPARKAAPAAMVEDRRIPLRGLRRKIAQHMTHSKQTAAHFTYVEEVDVSALVRLRKESKQSAAEQGVRLTYLPYIMKALLVGLRRHPALNAIMDDERSEIVLRHEYNLGIAVDTPDGLVVPVVKGVDRRSILELAAEVERVATAARAGKSSLEDLRGGTITITNAGNIGGLLATPIINYPEVAIVGVHKIARRPVVREERIEIGDIMYLSISIDHRVVDGAEGARFMNEVKRVLENPGLLLLES